jgi:hypothetical protein
MSDQERWLNEILDILGLPRDTAYRDYARELVEQGAPLERVVAIADEFETIVKERPTYSRADPPPLRLSNSEALASYKLTPKSCPPAPAG